MFTTISYINKNGEVKQEIIPDNKVNEFISKMINDKKMLSNEELRKLIKERENEK